VGGGYGSIIIGTNQQSHNASKDGGVSPHLLMFGSNQNYGQQKKGPSIGLAESERRRQQQHSGGLIKKSNGMTHEEKQRSIRSANTSPTTHHFLMNGLAAAANSGNQGNS
jgi:hypothetical protein